MRTDACSEKGVATARVGLASAARGWANVVESPAKRNKDRAQPITMDGCGKER